VEPVSIDEAYLDVTVNNMNNPSATRIAAEIRQRIKEETKLTASAGVSYCKFLAKIGSDLDKPDGLVVITPDKAIDMLSKLPIGKFHGIGKATEEKMKQLGIHNGFDLRKCDLHALLKRFGKAGQYYYNIVRGIDERQVVTSRIRKSISMERTFSADLDDLAALKEYLTTIADKLTGKMNEKGFKAQTLTVKVKYSNFEIVQRSCSAKRAFDETNIISGQAYCLLEEFYDRQRSVRLVGIGLSNLVWKEKVIQKQMTMPFYDDKKYIRISNKDKIF
jgi:DNA polymerase-4